MTADPFRNVTALDRERDVVAAVLHDNDAYIEHCTRLEPSHFQNPMYASVWEVVASKIDGGHPCSFLTVQPAMARAMGDVEAGELEAVTSTLRDARPSRKDVQTSVAGILDQYKRRRVYDICADAMRTAADPGVEIGHEHVERLIESADSILSRTGFAGSVDSNSVIKGLRSVLLSGVADPRCKTGLVDLDRLMQGGGIFAPWLIILAGRPGMGKSLLATQIASNVARAGGGVLYISLEMSAQENMQRAVVSEAARVDGMSAPDGYAFYDRNRTPEAEAILHRAMDRLDDLPIQWDDGEGLKLANIPLRVERAKRELRRKGHELALVVVDHLGLVPGAPGKSPFERTSAISNALKHLAKSADVPVLSLCQLNRGVESRAEKRPQMNDLRNSGDIEQDADLIMLLYRDAYYAAKESTDGLDGTELVKLMRRQESPDLEVDLNKNRHGKTGLVTLWCDPAHMIVTNAAPDFRNSEAA